MQSCALMSMWLICVARSYLSGTLPGCTEFPSSVISSRPVSISLYPNSVAVWPNHYSWIQKGDEWTKGSWHPNTFCSLPKTVVAFTECFFRWNYAIHSPNRLVQECELVLRKRLIGKLKYDFYNKVDVFSNFRKA